MARQDRRRATSAGADPAEDRRVQSAVTDALLEDRQLEAAYRRKGEREARRYILNPLALLQRGPITYLLATADGHEDALLFALHRFERVNVTNAPAKRPKGFALQDCLSNRAAHYGSGKHIRLEASFDAAAGEHLRVTPISEEQTRSADGENRLRLRANVPDTPQLRWWLLAFGNAVTVEAPAALRQWFAEKTAAMAACYADDLPREVALRSRTTLDGALAKCHAVYCSAYALSAEMPSTGTITLKLRITAGLAV